MKSCEPAVKFVNICGGLGNQLFQYAFAKALSYRNKIPVLLVSDQYKSFKMHNGYELGDVFGIDSSLVDRHALKKNIGWRANPIIRRVLKRSFFSMCRGSGFYIEPNFGYNPDALSICSSVYFDGYWQSPKYFSEIEQSLREDLVFRNPLTDFNRELKYRIESSPSASIHIRQGDYLHSKNKSIFAHCTRDYYKRAMNKLISISPKLKFYVFTDQPDCLSAMLPTGYDITPILHNTGASSYIDMQLMSSAQYNITANSTFSWWAAWLNNNPNKLVITPKRWFQDNRDIKDLVPSSWIKLNN